MPEVKEKSVEATGKVRIIKIPAGEVPLEVRKAWVGLYLPCLPESGYPTWEDRGRGALSKKQAHKGRRVVKVPQKEALKILIKRNPKAAKWWYVHGFPEPASDTTGFFEFGEDEVQIISGVKELPVHQFIPEDMEGGDPCVECGEEMGLLELQSKQRKPKG